MLLHDGHHGLLSALNPVTHACTLQLDFVVAFLGVTYARAVAAPLNAAYKAVRPPVNSTPSLHMSSQSKDNADQHIPIPSTFVN